MDYSAWGERELIEELERRDAILPALKVLMDKIDRHVLHATYQEDTKEAYARVKDWLERIKEVDEDDGSDYVCDRVDEHTHGIECDYVQG